MYDILIGIKSDGREFSSNLFTDKGNSIVMKVFDISDWKKGEIISRIQFVK